MTQHQAKEVSRRLAKLIYVIQMAQFKKDWKPAIRDLSDALTTAFPQSSEGGKP